jgi:hypothetical protein
MLTRFLARRRALAVLSRTIPQRATAHSAARVTFCRDAFGARASKYLSVLAS